MSTGQWIVLLLAALAMLIGCQSTGGKLIGHESAAEIDRDVDGPLQT
jgi:hypothetical protein